MEKNNPMTIQQLTSGTVRTATTAWDQDHPTRFRAAFSTVQGDDRSVHLGIFSDNRLQCVVTLVPRALGIYEVHLSAQKGAVVSDLLPAFFSIRQRLFGELGVREITGWVPRLHRGIRRVAQWMGFRESGVTVLKMTNNRLTEELQVVLTNG